MALDDGAGDSVAAGELEAVALMLLLCVEEAVSERVAAAERVALLLTLALALPLPLPLKLAV